MLISYDHYALLRDAFGAKYLQDDFFYNLYLFAEQAKEKEIPFYIYLQTMGFYDNVAIETTRSSAGSATRAWRSA